MKKFLLSRNRNFPFRLFGMQHIGMIIVTLILFIVAHNISKYEKLKQPKNFKILRIVMATIILLNMFIYRGSYIYYGVYNIKYHLSLYYCHIINYLFVFSLFMNYKPFYKVIFGLSWLGTVWTVFFPDVPSGIDCFILYSSFISHNLLLVFITFVVSIQKIEFKITDSFKSIFYALLILLFTNCVNYDFGTKFNVPSVIVRNIVNVDKYNAYIVLLIMGFIGSLVGYFINRIYVKNQKNIKR